MCGGGVCACCKYSEAALKVFITPDRSSCLENPARDWEVRKVLFLQLDRWTRPRGTESEEGKLDLPCLSQPFLCMHAVPGTWDPGACLPR